MADQIAQNPDKRKKVKIKYIFRDDYNPVYSNGAYGGVTSSGEIVANFYFERHPLPNAEILGPDSHAYEPNDLPNSAVRCVETGVILSPETARRLAAWLLKQADNASQMNNRAETGDKANGKA